MSRSQLECSHDCVRMGLDCQIVLYSKWNRSCAVARAVSTLELHGGSNAIDVLLRDDTDKGEKRAAKVTFDEAT